MRGRPLTEIKFFAVLWSLAMALYFVFGGDSPVWDSMFYCVTCLIGINNASPESQPEDLKWKKVGSTVLKTVLIMFVLVYAEPRFDNVYTNTMIGVFFASIVIVNLLRGNED